MPVDWCGAPDEALFVSGSASVNTEEASTTYFSPRVINEAL